VSQPGFFDDDELLDGLLVHAHGIVDGKFIPRHALVDVTGPVHAGNVCDARERRAVGPHRRSTVKWDGTSTTALEVIHGINTIVSMSEFRVPKDATCGITVITQSVLLPLVDVALGRGFAGAVGVRSAFSVALLVGRFANAFAVGWSVTVRAVEVATVVL